MKAEEEAAKPEEKPVQEEKADEQKTEAKENADKPAENKDAATPKAGENVQTATIGTGDKTVTVKTTAAAGVLPEGAKLVVKKLADKDQAYQDAESTLKDSQVTYDDFLALDVGFEVNGKEVEPEAGSVQVQFELGAGLLPETANLDSLSVQHLTDGKAETVTNEVAVTESGVKADFTVSSFSTFTITWWGDGDYNKYYEFTVHYVDEKGNEINPSASNIELSYGKTINFFDEYNNSIEGYQWLNAYYGSYTQNGTNQAITTMEASGERTKKGNVFVGYWWEYQRYDITFKNGNTVVQSFQQKQSEKPTAKTGDIYLVFQKNTTGDTGGTIGDITLPAPGHTKKAVRKDDGTYDLSLDVSGSIGSEAKKIPLDVVMIIDKSNSMDDDNKLTTVKSAAKKLVNTLNGNNSIDVRYNIVEFGGTADPTTNIASSSGWKSSASEAGTAIDNVQTAEDYSLGGTNYQAGIRVAKQQLNLARTGAQTVVIFFTDGIPTYRLSNPQLEYNNYSPYYYGAGNHDKNGYNIAAAAAEIKGMYTNRFYAVGQYSKEDEKDGTNNLQTLVDNVNASSKQKYVADNTSQIENIFNNISSEILELTCTKVSITDTLNENAQIVKTANGKTPLTITVTKKNGTVVGTETGDNEVTLTVPATTQNPEGKNRTLTASYVEKNGERKIKLIFPDEYSLEADYTYTVTTPIEPTERAYEKYRGNGETYPDTPDAGTGTHADNNKEKGFYCNDTAQLKYNNGKGDETVDYDKPVIRLTPGNLVIKKTIAGELTEAQVEELEKKLTFKYTLNGGAEQSTQLTGWTKDETNGTYTARKTVASGLSPNTTYTVTEANENVEGYVVATTKNNDSGTISKGETQTASFTNSYTPSNRTITLKKVVTGNMGDKDRSFNFSATKATLGETSLKDSGTTTITAKVGETVTIREADYTADGYTTTASATNDVTDGKYEDHSYTFTVTKDMNESTIITFTNTKTIQPPNSSDLLQYKPSADDPESLTFEELLKLNPDVCAWITVDDTHIDYPVVQGKDNMEYVNKDVKGEFAFSGAIFLDSQNKRDFSDSYNLLYGHHMEGGAMFGDVVEFRDKSYFDSHETGTLYLPGKAIPITFFACVSTDAFDSVVYHPDAQPAGDVTTLLNYLQGTAVQYRDIGVTAKDQIIGLSTCSEAVTNGRVVLFGRLDK